VNDRINAARPPTPPEPKTGKLAPGQINNNRDLDVEAKKEDPGFFASFFPSKSKSSAAPKSTEVATSASTMEAPPAILRSSAAFNPRETRETEIISACYIKLCTHPHRMLGLLIQSYFNIVKREMIDTVPKAISLTLVAHSTKNLQRELLQELYKPETIDELLKESEGVVTRRREVTAMVEALNKAEEYVLSAIVC
jgi:dynamin 1-like protein